jgi:hypothetical protein
MILNDNDKNNLVGFNNEESQAKCPPDSKSALRLLNKSVNHSAVTVGFFTV